MRPYLISKYSNENKCSKKHLMASNDSEGWRMLHFKHLSVRATQDSYSQLRERWGWRGKRNTKNCNRFWAVCFVLNSNFLVIIIITNISQMSIKFNPCKNTYLDIERNWGNLGEGWICLMLQHITSVQVRTLKEGKGAAPSVRVTPL